MPTYHAFYKGKVHELTASTTLEAQLKAAKFFNAKKSWQVSVVLVALNGVQVVHKPQDICG